MSTVRWGLLALLAAAVVEAAPDPKAAPPPRKTTPHIDVAPVKPTFLDPLARFALHGRMERHGQVMGRLVRAVILVQREAIRAAAEAIASEPRLTRPLAGGEGDLNAALPERFFVLQDELRTRAKALASTSASADEAVISRAFGELTATCTACHAAFLDPNEPPRKLEEPPKD